MHEGLEATEVWTKWTGQVIDGLFRLHSCIGHSDSGGVFLTESPTRDAAKAALKLVPVPALPTEAARQLAYWNTAAGLAHPHLVRLLRAGRCQLAESQYLYVIMEYADQNLADLLLRRALTREEAWELLQPTIDALAFLHRRQLVQGHLKPSNILVVGDTVKLASDRIHTADEVAWNSGKPSAYYPPEGGGGKAADIWALGVTLAEGLTRTHLATPVESGKEPVLPPDFPPTFADAVRRCLSYEPTERPSAADLQAWIKVGAQQAVESVPTDSTAPEQPLRRHRALAFSIAGVVALVLVCWAVARLLSGPAPDPPAAPAPAPIAAAPAPVTPATTAPPAQPVALAPEAAPKPPEAPDPVEESEKPLQAASSVPSTEAPAVEAVTGPSVLHKAIPKVPRAARETIQESIRVIVRVTVDSSGTVVREVLADPGSSTYFAQLAINAAGDWKFAQAHDQPSRQWLVSFVFSRDGTVAHTIPLRPKRPAVPH